MCIRDSCSTLFPPLDHQVCDEFGLQIQTAGLAISYFDRYACKIEKFGPQSGTAIAIERAVFACVLIGAKFMETKVPAIGELRLFGAMEHSRESIKQAELEVLDVLGWGLSTSTPHTFLAQLAVIMDLPEAITTRSEFLIDMCAPHLLPLRTFRTPPPCSHPFPRSSHQPAGNEATLFLKCTVLSCEQELL